MGSAAVDLALDSNNVIIPTGNWTFSSIVTFPEGINIKSTGHDSTTLTQSDQNNDPIFKVITAYYHTTAIGVLRSGTRTAWIDKMSI